jgi:hypothetical protein
MYAKVKEIITLSKTLNASSIITFVKIKIRNTTKDIETFFLMLYLNKIT